MVSSEDRTRLTQEQAYELVQVYVKSLWRQYKDAIPGMDWEDVVMDIMLKISKQNANPDYDPNWKPGEVVHRKRSSGKDYKDVDTSYMLADGFNPEDPYDWLYHTVNKPTISQIDKYDGKVTSKKYFIQTIVKNYLIDLTRKRDALRYSDSLDDTAYDDGESRVTKGDLVADPSSTEEVRAEKLRQQELHDILVEILSELPITPLSDRIVGWSPITGQKDAEGNPIEAHLTARDIGLFILYGYTPEDVVKMYHDSRTGDAVSLSTIKKKWAEALEVIKRACLNSEKLKNTGYLAGFMDK